MTTTRVMRASEVTGLPVVTINGGDDVAEIKDVVFDGTNHRLVGFTLNKRGWFRGKLRQQLPAGSVVAIGPDAVMVADDSDLEDPEVPLHKAETHAVIGNRVISADGSNLGHISGVIITTGDDPEAVGYEVDGDDGNAYFVPISAQMALSDNNLLIPESSTDFIRNDLVGFGAALAGHREALDADSQSGAIAASGSETRSGSTIQPGSAATPEAESTGGTGS